VFQQCNGQFLRDNALYDWDATRGVKINRIKQMKTERAVGLLFGVSTRMANIKKATMFYSCKGTL
jgi:hypothetical protein